jgi:hypothetical protein
VDPLNNGFHFSFDGGDEKTTGHDNNMMVITNPHASAASHMRGADIPIDSMEIYYRNEKHLFKIEDRVIKLKAEQHYHYNNLNSKMDSLL